MRRLAAAPRADWRARVEALGLVWHTGPEGPYWDEGSAWAFSAEEIARLEAAVEELARLFAAAAEHVVRHRLYARLAIPDWCAPLIERAWEDGAPALDYGRFDLGYDGAGPPKLFEYNCDTPTALLEAAVVQWAWKEEAFPHLDQFNSLHDRLVRRWRALAPALGPGPVHFAYAEEPSGEDAVTAAYMMDTAREAGLEGRLMRMSEIGCDGRRFYDADEREIATLQHLYPWEWMVAEPFGAALPANGGRTRFLEPIWKMVWSNKAILPILWELFPDHPNLLWAGLAPPAGGDFARKPLLSREGANVALFRKGTCFAERGGPYEGPVVYQALFEDGHDPARRPVLGAWSVAGAAAGLGVREGGAITGEGARFVPHVIEG